MRRPDSLPDKVYLTEAATGLRHIALGQERAAGLVEAVSPEADGPTWPRNGSRTQIFVRMRPSTHR
jgi:hypothetical protein